MTGHEAAEPRRKAKQQAAVFVAERAGNVMVGYRDYPEGPMDKVEALLDGIAREAVGRLPSTRTELAN